MRRNAISTLKIIVAALTLTASGLAAIPPSMSAQSFSPDRDAARWAAGFGAAIAIGDGEIFVGRTGGGGGGRDLSFAGQRLRLRAGR